MQALCLSAGHFGPPCHAARLHEGASSSDLRQARPQVGCVSCLAGQSPPALPKRRQGSASSCAPPPRSFQPIRLGVVSVRHAFSATRSVPSVESTGSNAAEEGHLCWVHAVPGLRRASMTQTRALQCPGLASRQLSGFRVCRGAFFRERRPIVFRTPARILASPVAFSRGPGNGSSSDPLGVFSFLDYAFSAGMSQPARRA